MIKRVLDVTISLTGLMVLAPVLLLVAVLIKNDSRGPVFYRGLRVGRWGRPFRIFKFRTMVVRADQVGGPSSPEDDPRTTAVGKFLRKHKLDELPQLINVLTGDMSLVGPRPEVPEYVALFSREEKAILSVRPGITDWASIWNRDEGAVLAGSQDPEKTYLEKIRPEKLRLQLEYVQKQSLWVDLRILAETLRVLLARPRTVRQAGLLHGRSEPWSN